MLFTNNTSPNVLICQIIGIFIVNLVTFISYIVCETFLPSKVQLSGMIMGDMRKKSDNLIDTFRSRGIFNLITIAEQILYLMFIHDLDEVESIEGKITKRMRGVGLRCEHEN